MARGVAEDSPQAAVTTYRLLGGIRAERAGETLDLGGPKQRAVLAALLVDAGRVVTVDQLLDRVWGSTIPKQARTSLQAYVSNLRRLLDPDRAAGQSSTTIVTRPSGYSIEIARDQLDVTRFEDLHDEGLRSLTAGDSATTADRLDAALTLFEPAVSELTGQPWVMELQSRLDALHAEALEGAFEAKLALGQDRNLLPDLETAVTAHPFRERLRCHLALALYRSGRQTDALRALAEARRSLAEEVGLDPGPDLVRLESEILAHSPSLSLEEEPATEELSTTAPSRTLAQSPRSSSREVALVGRADELEALVEAAAAATQGTGGSAVISGEPGIGKTRLAAELVASAAPHDPSGGEMVVAWARCPEGAAVAPGWMCTQLFKQVVAAGALDAAAVDEAAASAARSGHNSSGLTDPGAERFEFHSAAAATLRTTERPLLLVVDDLQWADPSSLRLLEFLAGELRTMPVLLVATMRPLGPEPSAALVACLSELARHSAVRRLDLDGLDHRQVELWMRRRSAGTVDPTVAELVHHQTEGNPFFVSEVVELLAARGGFANADEVHDLGVPAAVQDVVRRRVDVLPDETRKVLATAAVLGGTIYVDVLAHVTAQSVPATIGVLDAAVEAGLLVEDRLIPGQIRFAHALVADALAVDVTMSRRAGLHAAAVEALEDLRPTALDEHLAKLAYHAAHGAIAGTGQQAVEYATRAAHLATDQTQHEEAVTYWEQALRYVDLAHPGDRRARLDILIELGDSRRRTDNFIDAQEALLEAITLAGALGDAAEERRAASKLPPTSLWASNLYGQTHSELVAILERVLTSLDNTPTVERAELLGGLADLAYYADPDQADTWSLEAVSVARQVDDAQTLARALNRRWLALQRPRRSTERRDAVDELVSLAIEPGLPADLACIGYYGRAAMAFEEGNLTTLEADMDRARELANRAGSPGLRAQIGWFEVSMKLACGHYEEARSMAHDAYTLHRRARRLDAEAVLAAYLALADHDQGTVADLPEELHTVQAQFAAAALEIQTLMLTENGELDEARMLAGPPGTVPDMPDDWTTLALTAAAANSRAALGDADACRILHQRLAPHAGTMAVAAPGGPAIGAVDLALARLASVLGDDAMARRHINAAIDLLDRIGARPWLARALLTQHDLLARSDDPADKSAASRALERCRALATELGLAPVLASLEP